MFTAYFNALTLVYDESFNTLLTMQIKENRHFHSHTITTLAQLDKIDTTQFNVIFYQLDQQATPHRLIQLVELSKSAKLVVIAHEQHYANLAFEIGAVDFLSLASPISRINKSFEKLIHLCPLANAMDESHREPDVNSQIIVKDIGKIRLIEVDDVIWINGAGNYVELHFWQQEQAVLHRETMKNMEQQLAPAGFIRIHRSTLVKKSVISELSATESGDYKVKLKNSVQLNLSRRYKNNLANII